MQERCWDASVGSHHCQLLTSAGRRRWYVTTARWRYWYTTAARWRHSRLQLRGADVFGRPFDRQGGGHQYGGGRPSPAWPLTAGQQGGDRQLSVSVSLAGQLTAGGLGADGPPPVSSVGGGYSVKPQPQPGVFPQQLGAYLTGQPATGMSGAEGREGGTAEEWWHVKARRQTAQRDSAMK